ncbi:hypothetical protein POJ06DRAFT_261967 [Lipomyces tetrasporus]|uniref:LSM complex subunit LSM4 n=1 Tax=Lipomyces tetrasporus TaxID=54092 RepID=A0AAD7QLW8_9ASCO|nr:uncharacterized protein POJ06DRAFT_261967 [Lipomyces tetrasporus]KAJ8097639.1 hypothetical protein POJ06DRAFT_261967 [Lipomyces tetrasporus]
MLPLTLLNTSQGHPMLVELKSGETLNGHLVNCDAWMNLTLKEVVQTNADGTRFFRLPECYVRGNNIKYLRVPDEVLDIAREKNQQQREEQRKSNQPQRGGYNRQYTSGGQRGGYNRNRGGGNVGRGGGHLQRGGRGGQY